MKFVIYGIIDSLTREMRYVGKSSSGLRRPRGHFRKSSRQTHLSNFIQRSISEGNTPEIVILEILRDHSDLSVSEIGWIKYFRDIGCRLINQTLGGEGVPGLKHSPQTLERIANANRGRRHSENAKLKIAFARTGMKSPHSNETRMKISDAMKRSWERRKMP